MPGVGKVWKYAGKRCCYTVLLHYVLMHCGDLFYFILFFHYFSLKTMQNIGYEILCLPLSLLTQSVGRIAAKIFSKPQQQALAALLPPFTHVLPSFSSSFSFSLHIFSHFRYTTYTCTYIFIFVCIYIHIFIYILYIHIYTLHFHIHTHIHIHIHIHIYYSRPYRYAYTYTYMSYMYMYT